MQERVKHIMGNKPVILVCPHSADDTNTDIIAEEATKILNCYAVINKGFERADTVDVNKDIADCNRIDHVKQDVVYEEYLKPIIKYIKKISLPHSKNSFDINPAYIFHIHGCGNHVHKEAKEQIGVIIGYGLGSKKDSMTCEIWHKNLFINLWRSMFMTGEAYEGKGGGRYSGRDSNNMNQYFRKHENIDSVYSMQLEFPFSMRNNEKAAKATGTTLAGVIAAFLSRQYYDKKVGSKFI